MKELKYLEGVREVEFDQSWYPRMDDLNQVDW